MLLKPLCLFLLTAFGLLSGPAHYSGPNCLGPFCIDRNVSTRTLFKQLGPPPHRSSGFSPFCYESEDHKTFLYIGTIDSMPDIAGDILLSDFRNCSHMPIKITRKQLASWSTRAGIKLGSSEAEVLKAYGKPRAEMKIDSEALPTLIRGYARADRTPTMSEIGRKRLFYNGDITNDLRAAEFGIRGVRVSYIWISHNE